MSSRCRPERSLIALAVLLLFAPLLACGLDLDLDLRSSSKKDPKKTPVEIDDEDEDAPGAKPKSPGGSKTVDLGTAVYPDGTPKKGAVSYLFDVPPKHRLAYRLSDDEQQAVEDFYADFARQVKFKRLTDKTFQWVPPPGCKPDMSCVYKKLIARTQRDVLPIVHRFKKRADSAKLNALQLASAVLSFVQEIPYQIPNDPFGLRPPPLTVAYRKGDCDSKVLLLYMILNPLGVETVVISSQAHQHTMAGIAVTAPGTTFRWKDRKYAFAETTAKNAPIGYLPKDVASPNDWHVELAP